MRPIPKSLLIHTVRLHKKINKDKWGKGELDQGVELSHVRIEPSEKIIRDKNNAEIQLSATLFYDCKNSNPRDMKFEKDDLIEFNGVMHRVEVVEPLYDDKRLHHYELGMVKGG